MPLGFFEIKTTSSANPRELTISSAAQLDDSFGKPIILIFLTIRLDANVGENLPDMVTGLRQNLAEHPDAVGVFEGKLFEAGYLNEDALEYSMPQYSVQNIVFYLVGPGFPRITPAMLPPGVSTVEYTINLASCRPHVIPQSRALNLVCDSHE